MENKILATQAKALALVDCVQDTYSNVAALIDDSVYNTEGGMEEDLEKMMLDLTRVDRRVTTIVAGVRSLSMTFKVYYTIGPACPKDYIVYPSLDSMHMSSVRSICSCTHRVVGAPYFVQALHRRYQNGM